jgi:hypothetical protein
MEKELFAKSSFIVPFSELKETAFSRVIVASNNTTKNL